MKNKAYIVTSVECRNEVTGVVIHGVFSDLKLAADCCELNKRKFLMTNITMINIDERQDIIISIGSDYYCDINKINLRGYIR